MIKRRSLLAVMTLIVLILAVTIGYILEKNSQHLNTDSSFLYMPHGKYVKIASLGFENVVADLIYLWTIQYSGDYSIKQNFIQLEHLYDVITDLDPLFLETYHIGALIFSTQGRNLEMALKLLDKGIEKNPEEWFLPLDAGFYCYNSKQYLRAARYFELSIRCEPGSVAKRLYAAMFEKDNNYEAALEQWTNIFYETEDESVRKIAEKHMFDMKVKIDVERISKAIATYRERYNRVPDKIMSLVSAGLLREKPVDPYGNSYIYNPETLEVLPSTEFDIQK